MRHLWLIAVVVLTTLILPRTVIASGPRFLTTRVGDSLYALETKASQDTAGMNLKQSIEASDDLQAALYKIRRAYTWDKQAPREGPADMRYSRQFLTLAKQGHERWPESSEIAAMYAYAALYNQTSAEALRIIIPYVQDSTRVPGISILLHRVFYTVYINYERTKDLRGGYEFVGQLGYPPEELLPVTKALAVYWGQRVNREAAGRLFITPAVPGAKEGPQSPEEQRMAIGTWTRILRHYGELGVEGKSPQGAIQEVREEQEKKRAEAMQQYQRDREQLFQKSLKRLGELEKGKNDLNAAEMLIRSVASVNLEKVRKQYPSIPNLEQLKAAFPNSDEPAFLNQLYRLIVFDDARGALEAVEQLQTKDKDIRLFYLKALAAARLRDWNLVEQTAKRILEIDPKQYRAQHMLIDVKALREEEASKKQ